MSREQERIQRKLESNPVVECNKVRIRYCPGLFQDFADTKDPRNLSYTEYSNNELLRTVFYKGIAGIEKGTEEETVNYHSDVLEAKIVLGESMVVSTGSEFIENNGEDTERQKNLSEEKRKQDCETKAFKRLAVKIKKAFPRLPIILLADSLYASDPVMGICRDNGWEFIIR